MFIISSRSKMLVFVLDNVILFRLLFFLGGGGRGSGPRDDSSVGQLMKSYPDSGNEVHSLS